MGFADEIIYVVDKRLNSSLSVFVMIPKKIYVIMSVRYSPYVFNLKLQRRIFTQIYLRPYSKLTVPFDHWFPKTLVLSLS